MKNVFLVYDNCCFYEIVTLSYFMKFTGEEAVLCSLNGESINCMEGYSVNVDLSLNDLELEEVKSFIITGGDISTINNKHVHDVINNLFKNNILISAICAGVDVLDNAGILEGINSTHSKAVDIEVDKNIITARANAYIDFAIEVAKKLDLFESEKDLQETIDFWKYHKGIE